MVLKSRLLRTISSTSVRAADFSKNKSPGYVEIRPTAGHNSQAHETCTPHGSPRTITTYTSFRRAIPLPRTQVHSSTAFWRWGGGGRRGGGIVYALDR